MSEPRPVRVKLLSYTHNAMETLWLVWMQSRRDQDEWPTATDLAIARDPRHNQYPTSYMCRTLSLAGYPFTGTTDAEYTALLNKFCDKFDETILDILSQSIPVVENISFTFLLENIPITLREQLVRHRIGSRIGPRLGVDIVPDLDESSWWSQTSRVVPFDDFYSAGRYVLPESLEGKEAMAYSLRTKQDEPVPAEEYYRNCLEVCEMTYKALVAAGVPLEDARNLIPLGATHSITWTLNLKAMMHIFGKRISWIAQLGIWEPVIAGMAKALVEEVDPALSVVTQPACFKRGEYVGCPVAETNMERIQGTDGDMPPCPLFVRHETSKAIDYALSGNVAPFPSTWFPPLANGGREPDGNRYNIDYDKVGDLRNWSYESERSNQMLHDNVKRFENLTQMKVFPS